MRAYEVLTAQSVDRIDAGHFEEAGGWLIFYNKEEAAIDAEVARFKSDAVLSVKLLPEIKTYATASV